MCQRLIVIMPDHCYISCNATRHSVLETYRAEELLELFAEIPTELGREPVTAACECPIMQRARSPVTENETDSMSLSQFETLSCTRQRSNILS